MDSAGEHRAWRKYYINVCRPLNPVPGCDRFAAACQMKYVKDQQVSRPPGKHLRGRAWLLRDSRVRVGLATGAGTLRKSPAPT